MSLQNRVSPSGEIFRTAARGTLMGNRGGAIHDENREIVRQYKSRSWITCVLEFKGRQRTVMSPGKYTELFFLDEAVAFAAGHRPCAECRRERFNALKAAWINAIPRDNSKRLLVHEIDTELHRSRINAKREKVTYEAALDSLPDGCFVRIGGFSYLVLDQSLVLWQPEGYGGAIHRPPGIRVTVLTPEPFVHCFRQGYKPVIHRSGSSLLSANPNQVCGTTVP